MEIGERETGQRRSGLKPSPTVRFLLLSPGRPAEIVEQKMGKVPRGTRDDESLCLGKVKSLIRVAARKWPILARPSISSVETVGKLLYSVIELLSIVFAVRWKISIPPPKAHPLQQTGQGLIAWGQLPLVSNAGEGAAPRLYRRFDFKPWKSTDDKHDTSDWHLGSPSYILSSCSPRRTARPLLAPCCAEPP